MRILINTLRHYIILCKNILRICVCSSRLCLFDEWYWNLLKWFKNVTAYYSMHNILCILFHAYYCSTQIFPYTHIITIIVLLFHAYYSMHIIPCILFHAYYSIHWYVLANYTSFTLWTCIWLRMLRVFWCVGSRSRKIYDVINWNVNRFNVFSSI